MKALVRGDAKPAQEARAIAAKAFLRVTLNA